MSTPATLPLPPYARHPAPPATAPAPARPAVRRLCLAPRGATGFTAAGPVRLASAAGTLWVTVDHDRRDVVLEAGESLAVAAGAAVTVSPLGGPAELVVVSASAAASPHGLQPAGAGR